MDIKKAEQIIRKMDNVNSIWYGCNYKNGFGFAASPNKDIVFGDPQVVFITIDQDENIETLRFAPSDINPKELIYIDMKPSDLGRIQ